MLGFAQTTPEKFHDTKGNIEVTKSGQLQYTLNIDAPTGIKDVRQASVSFIQVVDKTDLPDIIGISQDCL